MELIFAHQAESESERNTSIQSGLKDDVELKDVGSVKFAVYKTYWRAIGNLLTPTILFSLVAMQVSQNLTDIWLAHWVNMEENSTQPNISIPGIEEDNGYFVAHKVYFTYYLHIDIIVFL